MRIDVDAHFGYVSMWQRKHDALTLRGKYIAIPGFLKMQFCMGIEIKTALGS